MKKLTALLLAAAMVLSLLPAAAVAEEMIEEPAVIAEEALIEEIPAQPETEAAAEEESAEPDTEPAAEEAPAEPEAEPAAEPVEAAEPVSEPAEPAYPWSGMDDAAFAAYIRAEENAAALKVILMSEGSPIYAALMARAAQIADEALRLAVSELLQALAAPELPEEETETETEPVTAPEAEPEEEPEAESEPETEPETAPETEPMTDPAPVEETAPEAETEPVTAPVEEPEAESEPETAPAAEPARLNADVALLQSFVTRLYSICLDRAPGAAELSYYVDQLAAGTATGVGAASNFVFSGEFKAKNLCNDHYISYLYRVFFDRDPGAAELTYWAGQMTAGLMREQVFNGFAMSNEYKVLCQSYGIVQGAAIGIPAVGTVPDGPCTACASAPTGGDTEAVNSFVARLYSICLGREAGQAEIDYYTELLMSQSIAGAQAAWNFFSSPEFTAHNYDGREYITRLYNVLMGRDPGEAEIEYHLGRMTAGTTRSEIFNGFAQSPEFAGICSDYGIAAGDPVNDAAASGQCGENLSWILANTGELCIRGSGAMWDQSSAHPLWSSCAAQIRTVTIGSGATSVGAKAFENCSSLTGVDIPDTVTAIGEAAFSGCTGLTELSITGALTAIAPNTFYGCTALAKITLPNSITTIGRAAFSGCTSLAEMETVG